MKLGAINFAIGTAVAFGVIDAQGRLLKPLYGDSWEIGDFQINTRSDKKSLWQALGSQGFDELSQWRDQDGFKHYGIRLGKFVSQMSLLFRPRTVGLSGGIIRHNWPRIREGFDEGFSTIGDYADILPKPDVAAQDSDYTALAGLSTLLTRCSF